MFNHDEIREIDSSFYKLTRSLGDICSDHLQGERDRKPEHWSERGIFSSVNLDKPKAPCVTVTQVITNNLRSS